jgi:hypothetical protein
MEGGTYTLLPEGEYPFTVKMFEQGYHQPSEGGKIGECKKAMITLTVDGGEHGQADIKVDFFLWSTVEWKIHQFFRSIGDRKHGEKGTPNWKAVFRKTGWCKVKHRQGTNKHSDKKFNEVDYFIYPEDAPSGAQTPSPPPQAPAPQTAEDAAPWKQWGS